MRITKEELLAKVRDKAGETPDEYSISLMEDIADSFDPVDNTKIDELQTAMSSLQSAYDALKKSYADRFTMAADKAEEIVEEKAEEEVEADPYRVDEDADTYTSIFD